MLKTTGWEISTAFVFIKLHRQLFRIKFAANQMYLKELLSPNPLRRNAQVWLGQGGTKEGTGVPKPGF